MVVWQSMLFVDVQEVEQHQVREVLRCTPLTLAGLLCCHCFSKSASRLYNVGQECLTYVSQYIM